MSVHKASNLEEIHQVIVQQLKGPPSPSSLSLAERPLVLQALKLLIFLDLLDSDMTSLLMMYCGEGDTEIEGMAMQYLESKGVSDPHHYLTRELKERLSSTDLLPTSSTLSRSLLDSWAAEYLQAVGVKVTSKPATQTGRKKPGKANGRQQRGDKKTASHTGNNGVNINRTGATIGTGSVVTANSYTLPQYNPIDVINYFVKMEHERELARLATTMGNYNLVSHSLSGVGSPLLHQLPHHLK